jgi:hypothetical protein
MWGVSCNIRVESINVSDSVEKQIGVFWYICQISTKYFKTFEGLLQFFANIDWAARTSTNIGGQEALIHLRQNLTLTGHNPVCRAFVFDSSTSHWY